MSQTHCVPYGYNNWAPDLNYWGKVVRWNNILIILQSDWHVNQRVLTLGGNNPCLIPAPTGSEGNLHKGYVEAIDAPSLKSESSLILVLLLSVCVSVCIFILLLLLLFKYLWLCMCACVYMCRLVELTWMVRARKRWWPFSEPRLGVGLWTCWWFAKRTPCCPEKWSVPSHITYFHYCFPSQP